MAGHKGPITSDAIELEFGDVAGTVEQLSAAIHKDLMMYLERGPLATLREGESWVLLFGRRRRRSADKLRDTGGGVAHLLAQCL